MNTAVGSTYNLAETESFIQTSKPSFRFTLPHEAYIPRFFPTHVSSIRIALYGPPHYFAIISDVFSRDFIELHHDDLAINHRMSIAQGLEYLYLLRSGFSPDYLL